MMRTPDSLAIGRLVGWTALLATVMVMPWAAYDPINVPKLAVISIGGFIALAMLLVNRREFIEKQYRLVLIFGVVFITHLTVVLLVAGTNFNQEFFGTFGRATGYVTYLVLTFLLLAATIAASDLVLLRFSRYLLGAGLLSVIYGVFQTLKLDPINWVNQYSPVIGFLGNPNFQSSFIGFSSVLAFSMLIDPVLTKARKAGYATYIVVGAYVINGTESQQGFLVFIGGVAVVTLIWVSRSKYKLLTIPTLALGLDGFVLVAIGSLNKGPLASLLYKDSVTYRGDYWRAGWRMTVENPIFGVGLDSYGDWYRRARSLDAILRRGPDVTSNAAHNVLIDFSSNGGLPLLAIYMFMLLLVTIASIKIFRRNPEFDPVFSGLLAVWIAYQAQSIISLNQLGLAVWGWVISGLLIGYAANKTDPSLGSNKNRIKEKTKNIVTPRVRSNSVLGIFLGFIIGLLFALPPLLQTTSYKSGLESGDVNIISALGENKIMSCQNRVQLVMLLVQNGLEEKAKYLAEDGHSQCQDSYELWRLTSQIAERNTIEYKYALNQMKRLDPLNPTLK